MYVHTQTKLAGGSMMRNEYCPIAFSIFLASLISDPHGFKVGNLLNTRCGVVDWTHLIESSVTKLHQLKIEKQRLASLNKTQIVTK